MTLLTVRRLIVGFVAGITAGWLGGLMRTPREVRSPVDGAR